MITSAQKQEITDYLSGPRIYAAGVELYKRHGVNRMLLRRFQYDETETTREILFDELRKIAGLSELEYARLPRRAAKATPTPSIPGSAQKGNATQEPDEALMSLADSFGVTVDELVSPDFQDRVLAMDENAERVEELTDELEAVRSKYAATPEPVRKMIRFREKYKFLNDPKCPDVLKVLVADMFTAYGHYKQAFAELQKLPDNAEAAQALENCGTLVENYLRNREIWDELEYYRQKGTILGKAAKFKEIEAAEDLAELSDVELMKKIQSAKVNISKNKKRLAEGNTDEKTAALYDSWLQRLDELEKERDRRKKK